MTRRRHATLIAVSAAFGLAALASVWVALDPIATGRLLWLPGCALGSASSVVYVSGGGKSLRSAISASMLGSAFVTCTVVTFILIGAANDMPLYVLPLFAPAALIWAILPSAIYLVTPATGGTLVVFASATLARRLKS